MKQGLTHICFVVDRSFSMKGISAEMISGFNTFIEKQKENPGECLVSFYQFDNVYETVFERIPLRDVKPLTDKTYVPRGNTALLDAIGRTTVHYGNYLSSLPEEERPERVLFVTLTDGDENSSTEFRGDEGREKIRQMVKHQTEKYSWDYVFIGSNINAWGVGDSLGVASNSTLQFANVKGSVTRAMNSLSDNTLKYRSSFSKSNYAFESKDLASQDEYLSGDLKAQNQSQQKV